MRKGFISVLVLLGALALDLAAKAWVRTGFASLDGLDLTPFLALRVMFNDGTTIGFLSGRTTNDQIILTSATALAVVALGWWSLRTSQISIRVGAALVAAGALGNLIDRLQIGMVTDFLAVHWGTWQSPVFNLADLWMAIGVLLVLFPERQPDRVVP